MKGWPGSRRIRKNEMCIRDRRKEHFTPGAIQLNDAKVTDPAAVPELAPGSVLRRSKKHAVRFK